MKVIFELEWDDELGPKWMNVSNLQKCIDSVCSPGLCTVVRKMNKFTCLDEIIEGMRSTTKEEADLLTKHREKTSRKVKF